MLKTGLYAVLLAVLCAHLSQCAGPPRMDKSYMAYGEITQPLKDLQGYELQAAFEESYNAETENAAFVVWMLSQNVTFVKDYKTNQTFKYTKGEECEETNETEWLQSEYPPSLLAYEADDGTVRFSLKQLFNIPDEYLVSNKADVPTVYRGVPARMWLYEIIGRDMEKNSRKRRLNIYSYWSDGTWRTSSNEKTVPLGFVVAKTQWRNKEVKIEEMLINVFGFVSSTYNRKLFEPLQGVVCESRVQTWKFPGVQNLKAISLHSEMIFPDYQEIRYIDTWFDPRNQLVRIDASRLREEDPIAERKTKRYSSEIAVGQLGVVFRQSYFKSGFQCDIIPFPQYLNDMQNFIDVKQNLKKWRMEKLFGLNETSYVYTGQVVKSNIPCHVFQGIRHDWPEESANVTSLWEWCFNFNMSKDSNVVVFSSDEIGLVSAQVKILTSGQPDDYPVGFRMFHHFYDVTAPDPAILDATKFDISRCLSNKEKRLLQFALDLVITDSNIATAENLTSDLGFLQSWKSQLYSASGLPSYSLRIAKVRSTIAEGKLYIKFTILDKHKDLPKSIGPEEMSSFDAEKNLRDNENKLSIRYPTQKGSAPTTFKAAKGSITQQINPDFEHHTLPPPPPATSPETPSTGFTFSLKTDPDTHNKSTTDEYIEITSTTQSTGSHSSSTSSGSTPTSSPKPSENPEKRVVVKKSGHEPGAVAAISIITLLGGVTIGSAGTFYKFFGLPSFMRR